MKLGKILATLASSVVLVLVGCKETPSPAVVSQGPNAVSAGGASPKENAAPLASVPGSAASVASARPVAPSASANPSVAPPSSAAASASAPAVGTVPVEVTNFGLHIGGGPNDDVTKAPILRSVEPHFPELRACYAKAEEPRQKGDFGVDLAIERDGGKAQVSKPRTAIKGDAFRACVVGVFESVEFQKPRGGKTVASYSVRFLPR